MREAVEKVMSDNTLDASSIRPGRFRAPDRDLNTPHGNNSPRLSPRPAPAITVPMGFVRDSCGRLQVLGRAGRADPDQIGFAYEQATRHAAAREHRRCRRGVRRTTR